MPFSSGSFSLAAGNPVVTGTTISSTWANNTLSDIATGLSTCVLKDGSQTITANIPMAGFKFTGLGAGTSANDSVRLTQAQGAAYLTATAVAGTNTITGTLTPAITAYAAGQFVYFVPANTNTGATTAQWGGVGSAQNVFWNGAACVGGELRQNIPALLYHDGTQYHIVGNGFNAPFSDAHAVVEGSADATKKLRFEVDGLTTATTRVGTVPDYNFRLGNLPAGIGPLPYAGATVPTGWLECDGSAVSRTTYAALFTAIGTTWGAGDGSTTFNLPNCDGRLVIGDGTGTVVEAVTASSGNGFTVSANNTKWITGMTVVVSNLTGFGGTVSATSYFAGRVSSTNVRLASTLALAQAGSPDITITGTGTATLTTTFTARTLGEQGGEEGHAMSSTELLAHTHTTTGAVLGINASGSSVAGGVGYDRAGSTSDSRGGNAAMNIMQPFIVTKMIISY